MSGITINGINVPFVGERATGRRRTAGGVEPTLSATLRLFVDPAGTITYPILQDRARQLEELAANPVLSRAVYLQDDEVPTNTGLYRLDGVDVPVVSDRSLVREIAVSLTRLGAAGPGGGLVRRVQPAPVLVGNSWGITSDPWVAHPVGSLQLERPAGAFLTTADGVLPLLASGSPYRYLLDGADSNRGECKVWDTKGNSDPATWERVLSPDHRFASPAHCAIDNGLTRYVPSVASPGRHDVRGYAGGAWGSVCDATILDGIVIGSLNPNAWQDVAIEDLSTEIVVVRWWVSVGASPNRGWKRITLWRGKCLGLYELSAWDASSVYLRAGLEGSANRYAVSRSTSLSASPAAGANNAVDHQTTPGAAGMAIGYDNWAATFGAGALTRIGLIALPSTAYGLLKPSTGGLLTDITATGFAVYVGAVPYAGTAVQEAETGSLGGGATTAASVPGYAGTGHVVLPNTVGAAVQLTTVTLPAGTRVTVWWRVGVNSLAGADKLRFDIYNQTTSTYLAQYELTANNATHFPAVNTWYWRSLEAAWNGTDTLALIAVRSTAPTAANFVVDVGIGLTTYGGYGLPGRVANAALTEVRARQEAVRYG